MSDEPESKPSESVTPSEPVKSDVPDELLQSLNRGLRRKRSLLRQPDAELVKSESVKKSSGFESNKHESVTHHKTDDQKLENSQTKIKPAMSLDAIPEWLRKLNSIELLLLTFSDVPYSHDVFEQSLFLLFRRGWRFGKIRFYHYFLLGPISWLSFWGYFGRWSYFVFLLRWTVILAFPAVVIAAAHKLGEVFGSQKVVLPFAVIFTLAYILMHWFGCREAFQPWRSAYVLMKNHLKIMFSKKVRR